MDKQMTAVFYGATRKRNSKYGNPSFELMTSEGIFRTETDAAVNYSIANYTGRSSDNLVNQSVRFTLTRGNRVTHMEKADDV